MPANALRGHRRAGPYDRAVSVEVEANRLYGLPLERFTEARDALAARLRRLGDAVGAARVRALRKPTTAAWAANQLARRHPEQVSALLSASDRLRAAQRELLHGGPAAAVLEATLAEREAIGALVARAAELLREAGLGASPAVLDRVADTLAAASADPEGRELLRRGCLVTEMRRAGFEVLGVEGLAGAPVGAGERRRAAGPRAPADLEGEARRLERAAGQAEAEAERAARAAERAEREAAEARRRAAAAEEEARRARAEAAEARRAAVRARRAADTARRRLGREP
jgi:hypothetical protein